MSLKDLIADVNVNEICEHIETETLSEWVNAWQEAALSALRPVSRERVEKVWRGEWEQCFEDWRKQIEGDKCSRCGFEHYGTSIKKHHFCPQLRLTHDGRSCGDGNGEIGGAVWR